MEREGGGGGRERERERESTENTERERERERRGGGEYQKHKIINQIIFFEFESTKITYHRKPVNDFQPTDPSGKTD